METLSTLHPLSKLQGGSYCIRAIRTEVSLFTFLNQLRLLHLCCLREGSLDVINMIQMSQTKPYTEMPCVPHFSWFSIIFLTSNEPSRWSWITSSIENLLIGIEVWSFGLMGIFNNYPLNQTASRNDLPTLRLLMRRIVRVLWTWRSILYLKMSSPHFHLPIPGSTILPTR